MPPMESLRAFIFDMDGVLVDSEKAWKPCDSAILKKFFDERTREHIGDTTGLGVKGVYERALEAGSNISFKELAKAYDEAAREVYRVAPLTTGTEKLAEYLLQQNFSLGLVTSSPQNWIDQVVPRIPWKNWLAAIISIGDRPDLRPKPAPDGFIEALRTMNSDARQSFILEDSNYGLRAGKAAGCFTIGFSANLPEGYVQEGADAYADSMQGVIDVLQKL